MVQSLEPRILCFSTAGCGRTQLLRCRIQLSYLTVGRREGGSKGAVHVRSTPPSQACKPFIPPLAIPLYNKALAPHSAKGIGAGLSPKPPKATSLDSPHNRAVSSAGSPLLLGPSMGSHPCLEKKNGTQRKPGHH